MSVAQKRLIDAKCSFGLNRPFDMVAKLYREHERCKHPKTTDDRRDFCINFAITAWHLIDWMWVGIASEETGRLSVATLIGLTGKRLDKNDFTQWLIKECPELELCQASCTGSKHVLCDTTTQAFLAQRGVGLNLPSRQLIAQAAIENSVTRQDALEVFDKVLAFWTYQLT